jgi:hypothetical protein
MEFKVQFEDSSALTAVAKFADFSAWEQITNKSISSWAESVSLTDMARVSWLVLKREQQTKLKFEEWLLTVETIEPIDTEASPKAGSQEA